MAVHTIMLPDRLYGREPRTVIWDDVAGTVEGTHSSVPGMQAVLARPKPTDYSFEGRVLYLEDPGHDPAEFLWLLVTSFFPILREPLRSTLPPVFDGVELSPMAPGPNATPTANSPATWRTAGASASTPTTPERAPGPQIGKRARKTRQASRRPICFARTATPFLPDRST